MTETVKRKYRTKVLNADFNFDEPAAIEESKKYNHLTLEQRMLIERYLSYGFNYAMIAAIIGKSAGTVSSEIKKRAKSVRLNRVKKLRDRANSMVCPTLLNAPYVCNVCSHRLKVCGLNNRVYYAKHAQAEYEKLISKAHAGNIQGRSDA